MLRRPHEPARRAPVDGDEHPGWTDDLERRGAEPVTDGEEGADEAGWDAVAGTSEGDARVHVDRSRLADRRRIGHRRQGQQRLGIGELADRRGASRAGVGGRGAEAIEARLGLDDRGRGQGPLPAPAQVADRCFDRTLAVAPPGRTGPDLHAVVVGDRGEGWLDVG